MKESAWDQGIFVAHFYQLEGYTDGTRLFRVYRLICKPEFVLLAKSEALMLSLAARWCELGMNCKHVIIENSDWVASFQKEEPYGDSLSAEPMVHYVLCCGNDFAHLLSKDVPEVTQVGMLCDKDCENFQSCTSIIKERMDKIVRPTSRFTPFRSFDQVMRENIEFGRSKGDLKNV